MEKYCCNKKIILVFGTRPEAIKMCPIIKAAKEYKNIEVVVCVTGQHRDMLIPILEKFDVEPKYDLNIMKEGQSLADITTIILSKFDAILDIEKPDIVLVHGDTSSAFAAALTCFYKKIPIGHVEAGLRTYDKYSPYPEEFNRQAIDAMTDFYFAPTKEAKKNLLNEGKRTDRIYITGNTVIDALNVTVTEDYSHELFKWVGNDKLILLTAHRRENWGEPLKNIFEAIKEVIQEVQGIKVIYPMHMNPIIRDLAKEILKDEPKVKLIEPLDVFDFHNFMNKAYLVMTDSGGIQEEAPSLGKPVIVMRDTTERMEGVDVGTLLLVGTQKSNIKNALKRLLEDKELYQTMAQINNPYGDGKASERILKILTGEMKNDRCI